MNTEAKLAILNPYEQPALLAPGIAQSIGLAAIFYLIFTVVCIAVVAIKPFGDVAQNLFLYQLLIPQLVAWPITIWIALRWARVSFRQACPLTPFPLRILPALVLASFGAIVLLLEISNWIPMPEAVKKSLLDMFQTSSSSMLFFSLVIIAPIAEELFFRGVVLNGYRGRYSIVKAVWVSAILFAVFHLNPWQAVIALPAGLGCAWLRLRTGSVLPGMLSHAILNGSANFLLSPLMLALGYNVESIQAASHFPPLLIGIGATTAAIGGVLLWQQLKDHTER